MLGKLPGWLRGLVLLVVLYGVGNLMLVGGQKLWHHDDQVKLDNIKTSLASENTKINNLEAELKTLEIKIKRSESYINNVGQNSNDYNSLVDEHNAKIANYNVIYNEYKRGIDQYNLHVNEANELAKSIGSTWYVVPIPGGKRVHE